MAITKKKYYFVGFGILILVIAILFLYKSTKQQIAYFGEGSFKIKEDSIEYYSNSKQLLRQIDEWKKCKKTPFYEKIKKVWIDTILYNAERDRLLALVDILYSEESDMHDNSIVLVYGIKKNNNFSFYHWYHILADTNVEDSISYEGRKFLIFNTEYYFSGTTIKREKFWPDHLEYAEHDPKTFEGCEE